MVLSSGPFIVDHLRGRVESLTNALERAQERIDDLEKAFGSDAELMPLIRLGLTPSEARIIHLVRDRDFVTARQITFAIYYDNPDRANEVDAYNTMKTIVSKLRTKLRRYSLSLESVGWGADTSGYRMSGPSKSRLAKLIATGARSGVSMRQFLKQAAE